MNGDTMPRGKNFIEYTEEQLELLRNEYMTTKEIAKELNIGTATVCRARKRLGIKISRGMSKKGKPNPKKVRKETRKCANVNCDKEFVVIPSSIKKFCNHSCHGKTMKFPNRIRKCKDTTPEYRKYSRKVHKLSHKTYIYNIEIINPERHQRTLCGVEGGWQLDHIIPIKECYNKGISVEEASSINNLRMLPWKENLSRNKKCP